MNGSSSLGVGDAGAVEEDGGEPLIVWSLGSWMAGTAKSADRRPVQVAPATSEPLRVPLGQTRPTKTASKPPAATASAIQSMSCIGHAIKIQLMLMTKASANPAPSASLVLGPRANFRLGGPPGPGAAVVSGGAASTAGYSFGSEADAQRPLRYCKAMSDGLPSV